MNAGVAQSNCSEPQPYRILTLCLVVHLKSGITARHTLTCGIPAARYQLCHACCAARYWHAIMTHVIQHHIKLCCWYCLKTALTCRLTIQLSSPWHLLFAANQKTFCGEQYPFPPVVYHWSVEWANVWKQLQEQQSTDCFGT